MKSYIVVKEFENQSARSTYLEVQAPYYMYPKWEKILISNPELLELTLEKGPVLYTGIQKEDDFAIYTKFDEAPIESPLMPLKDYEHIEDWRKAIDASGFSGYIFYLTKDSISLLLKQPSQKINR